MSCSKVAGKRKRDTGEGRASKRRRTGVDRNNHVQVWLEGVLNDTIGVVVEGYELHETDTAAERTIKEHIIRLRTRLFFMDGCPEDQVELITAEEDDPIHVDAFQYKISGRATISKKSASTNRSKCGDEEVKEQGEGQIDNNELQFCSEGNETVKGAKKHVDTSSPSNHDSDIDYDSGSDPDSDSDSESPIIILDIEERAVRDKWCPNWRNRSGSGLNLVPANTYLFPKEAPISPPPPQVESELGNNAPEVDTTLKAAGKNGLEELSAVNEPKIFKQKTSKHHPKPTHLAEDDELAGRFHEPGFIPAPDSRCFNGVPVKQFIPTHSDFTYLLAELKERGYSIAQMVWLWGNPDYCPSKKSLGMRLGRYKTAGKTANSSCAPVKGRNRSIAKAKKSSAS